MIFTVGPIYNSKLNRAQLLSNAYRNCLALADKHKIKSIAFPSISTGVYGYPIQEASNIALGDIKRHLKGQTGITLVRIVLFSKPDFDVYANALAQLGTG